MKMLEKCWQEAHDRHQKDPGKTKAEHYREILLERMEKVESNETKTDKF